MFAHAFFAMTTRDNTNISNIRTPDKKGLKHIEDVRVFFCTQKYNFWQNCCNFDFDISDVSLQYWLNVLRVMGEDGARDKDWFRARGHHLCLTDTIF